VILPLLLSVALSGTGLVCSSETRVAALGDSITGNAADQFGPSSYPELLETGLGGTAKVRNFGLGGDTAVGAASRYASTIRGRGWNIVVIEICTNDFTAGATGAACWATVEALADDILEESGTRLILSTVMPRAGSVNYDATMQDNIDDFNLSVVAYVAAKALTHPGRVRLADLHLATRDPSAPDELLPAYDYGDHLHPNAAGLQAIADTVLAAIQSF
jgi:lysophospholipase L1-like esterase